MDVDMGGVSGGVGGPRGLVASQCLLFDTCARIHTYDRKHGHEQLKGASWRGAISNEGEAKGGQWTRQRR